MKTLYIIRNIILVSRTKWAAFNWSFAFYLDFRKEKPSLIFEILQRLSELRRFDMAVMFMSESEKKSEFYRKSFSFTLYSYVFLYLTNDRKYLLNVSYVQSVCNLIAV